LNAKAAKAAKKFSGGWRGGTFPTIQSPSECGNGSSMAQGRSGLAGIGRDAIVDRRVDAGEGDDRGVRLAPGCVRQAARNVRWLPASRQDDYKFFAEARHRRRTATEVPRTGRGDSASAW
jgi:hypothetical protein